MNETRLARVRARMEQEAIDTLIVASPSSMYYLTGHWMRPDERLLALVITAGEAVLLHNAVTLVPDALPRVPFTDADDAPAILAARIAGTRVGVDGNWPSRFALGLAARNPGLTLTIAGCVEAARMVKDAGEIERLRHASRVTDAVFAECLPLLREGMTEVEFGALIAAAFQGHGAGRFPGDPMVCFGPGSANPHHSPGGYALRRGDTVMVDTGMRMDGYYSDMTRTVFFGEPPTAMREVYEVVLMANHAALASVRPGVPLGEIDRAARSVIEAAGFGDYFTHRTGHGIGIDGHEEPSVSPGSAMLAEPGMAFSIEPGVYLPGWFGVRVEDLVVVTESGCEVITGCPKEMRVME